MTFWEELVRRKAGIFAGALVGLALTLYVKLQGFPLEFAVQSSGVVDRLIGANMALTELATTKVGIAFVLLGATTGYYLYEWFGRK